MSATATADIDDKAAVYLALELLRSKQDKLSPEGAAALEAHVNGLEELLGVSTSSPENFKTYSYFPKTLSDVLSVGANNPDEAVRIAPYRETLETAQRNPTFQSFVDLVSQRGFFEGVEPDSMDYLKRNAKLIAKFAQKVNSEKASAQSAEQQFKNEEKESLEKEAEENKELGNQALGSKDFDGAIHHYTEAINLSSSGPNTHIYYSNRAAAYIYKKEFKDAVDDCQQAISLCPSYSKAYARLGQACEKLSDFEKAVKAYETAAELDSNNPAYKTVLAATKEKLKEHRRKPPTPPPSAMDALAGGGGLEGLLQNPALLNNPMMQNMLSGVGGMEGISNMMKDPKAQQMMQQMMSNPQMMQQAMSMMGNLGLK